MIDETLEIKYVGCASVAGKEGTNCGGDVDAHRDGEEVVDAQGY